MNANATSLVRRDPDALRQVESLIEHDFPDDFVDQAIIEEIEAETALRQHVKIATAHDPAQRVRKPVAAAFDDSLVILFPDRSHEWEESILVVQNCHIAHGE